VAVTVLPSMYPPALSSQNALKTHSPVDSSHVCVLDDAKRPFVSLALNASKSSYEFKRFCCVRPIVKFGKPLACETAVYIFVAPFCAVLFVLPLLLS